MGDDSDMDREFGSEWMRVCVRERKRVPNSCGEKKRRNRLSAGPWLGGDNRLGRLNCGAKQLGFRASLQPWHSFLDRFTEVASCSEGCLAQPSNFGLGLVLGLPIPAL